MFPVVAPLSTVYAKGIMMVKYIKIWRLVYMYSLHCRVTCNCVNNILLIDFILVIAVINRHYMCFCKVFLGGRGSTVNRFYSRRLRIMIYSWTGSRRLIFATTIILNVQETLKACFAARNIRNDVVLAHEQKLVYSIIVCTY